MTDTPPNIAEQQQLNEELRFDREILAHMAQGLCLVRLDTATIAYANPRFEKMFGYGPGELVGRPVATLNAPTEISPEERAVEIMAVLQQSGEWHGEVKNIKKDGSCFWCEASVSIFDHSIYGKVCVALHSDITESKRIATSLRASKRRYKNLVNNTDDLITRVDNKGRLLFVNPSSQKYWGLPPEACRGRLAFDFICPDDRERTQTHFDSWLRSSEDVMIFENRQCHVSGEATRMQWMVTAVRDDKGEVVEFNGIARDVSKYNRAKDELQAKEHALRLQIEGFETSQKLLKESEERFKALHYASFGGVIIHEKGLILDCNQSLSDITGYTAEELIGMDGLKLIAPDSLPLVLKNIQTGYDQQYEVEGVRKDGSIYPLAIRGKNAQYKGRAVRVIEFRDISARRQAEKALRESEARFRQIFETIPDPVVLATLDEGVIIDVNKAFEKATGILRMEVLGHDSTQLGLWSDKNMRGPFRELLMSQGEVNNLEADFRMRGGKIRTGLLSARVLRLNNQDCSLLVIRDVTTEKAAEKVLVEMDRMKSEFISAAAHELNTPLSAILGYTELLLDSETFGVFSEEQKQDFLREVYDRGEALSGIIDDLLDISRIESGQSVLLNLQPTDVGDMLQKTVAFYQRKHPAYCFQLDLPERSDSLMPQIDRHRIVQVLENLVSNAVKYSSAGSSIVVGCAPISAGWEIRVVDSGIGMTPQQLERVFEKFYRVDATDTAVSGLGLGMSIARQIVEEHGGEITVESQLGGGTRVCFTLPVLLTELHEGSHQKQE